MDATGEDLKPGLLYAVANCRWKSRRMRHWLDLATDQNPGWYPGEYAHIDKNSVKDRNVC